jgi:hypothetical protein
MKLGSLRHRPINFCSLVCLPRIIYNKPPSSIGVMTQNVRRFGHKPLPQANAGYYIEVLNYKLSTAHLEVVKLFNYGAGIDSR